MKLRFEAFLLGSFYETDGAELEEKIYFFGKCSLLLMRGMGGGGA